MLGNGHQKERMNVIFLIWRQMFLKVRWRLANKFASYVDPNFLSRIIEKVIEH